MNNAKLEAQAPTIKESIIKILNAIPYDQSSRKAAIEGVAELLAIRIEVGGNYPVDIDRNPKNVAVASPAFAPAPSPLATSTAVPAPKRTQAFTREPNGKFARLYNIAKFDYPIHGDTRYGYSSRSVIVDQKNQPDANALYGFDLTVGNYRSFNKEKVRGSLIFVKDYAPGVRGTLQTLKLI